MMVVRSLCGGDNGCTVTSAALVYTVVDHVTEAHRHHRSHRTHSRLLAGVCLANTGAQLTSRAPLSSLDSSGLTLLTATRH